MCYHATKTTSVDEWIVYDIVYDIVCETYDIVCQNTVLANRMYDIVYDIVCDIVGFLYDIVRTTYDIAKKRTISYVFDLFLPVVCATSYTTSYVFYRCRIRHRTFFHASSVLYDIVGEVTMSIVTSTKTYDIVLRRRRQYRSMRYSIRYAPNLRYSIRYALKFACLE